MIAEVIAQEGSNIGTDWAQVFGTAGPLAGVAALLGYLLKFWLDSRKERRADKVADREGEVGAVAAARDAVTLVREQMLAMKMDIAELRAELEASRETIEKQGNLIRSLESELSVLRVRKDL